MVQSAFVVVVVDQVKMMIQLLLIYLNHPILIVFAPIFIFYNNTKKNYIALS
jgi:hypothetical protein